MIETKTVARFRAKRTQLDFESYVDVSASVSSSEVIQDGRLVEVGQVSHVFEFLELRWVHLLDQIFLDRLLLRW